jgi:hypothetical protein
MRLKAEIREVLTTCGSWLLYFFVFGYVTLRLVTRFPALQRWNAVDPLSFFFVFFFGPMIMIGLAWALYGCYQDRRKRRAQTKHL